MGRRRYGKTTVWEDDGMGDEGQARHAIESPADHCTAVADAGTSATAAG